MKVQAFYFLISCSIFLTLTSNKPFQLEGDQHTKFSKNLSQQFLQKILLTQVTRSYYCCRLTFIDNNVSKNINPDTLRKIFYFCKYSLRTLHKKPDFEALCVDIAQIAEAKKEAKKLLQNRRKRKSGKKQKSQ